MSKNEKSIKPDFKESVEYHLLLDDLMQKLESPEHQFSGNVSFYYREKQKKSRKRK